MAATKFRMAELLIMLRPTVKTKPTKITQKGKLLEEVKKVTTLHRYTMIATTVQSGVTMYGATM